MLKYGISGTFSLGFIQGEALQVKLLVNSRRDETQS